MFKPGDKVRCVMTSGNPDINLNDIYTISDVNGDYVTIDVNPSKDYWASRFILVSNTDTDMVNHPKHYTSDPSGVECINVIEHRNYNVGAAIKYIWRAGLKGDGDSSKHIEDLRKAAWYCNREIERIGKFGK